MGTTEVLHPEEIAQLKVYVEGRHMTHVCRSLKAHLEDLMRQGNLKGPR